MKYHSTRGITPLSSNKSFEDVLLSAYAPDGGLYVPDSIPKFTREKIEYYIDQEYSYPQICAEVLHLYSDIDLEVLELMTKKVFSSFNIANEYNHLDIIHQYPSNSPAYDYHNILPILKLSEYGIYLLDLSLGPTFAFKDIGQQIVGQLINYILGLQHKKATICVDTSGDTGPAAIAGVEGCEYVDIYCLYPNNRVTPIQELQMITNQSPNVHVYRTDGDSDEQASVLKELFTDKEFMDRYNICCVNSINWVRIATQSSYYIWCYIKLCQQKVISLSDSIEFCIPTGAFGNGMGCYLAKLMGIPVQRIYCATNSNDVVHRTIKSGDIRMTASIQTVSPAMDIQFAYNLERMLYYIFEEDTIKIKYIMEIIEDNYINMSGDSKGYQLTECELLKIHEIFVSYSVSDEDTLATIKQIEEKYQFLLCPHSATAVYTALHPCKDIISNTAVCIITAHPCKFESAIVQATGKIPIYPSTITKMYDMPKRFKVLEKPLCNNNINYNNSKCLIEKNNWRKEWIEILKNDIANNN